LATHTQLSKAGIVFSAETAPDNPES